ncbi:MAG: glycosyltransferase, partial [Candidatus Bathyarchaeia archaeon]
MVHVSVGIIVYNEGKNILDLLQSVSEQKLQKALIDEVIVVSSGSTDKTNEHVLEYSKRNGKVRLIAQAKREGKALAINIFLKNSRNEIVLVSGGDVIFAAETVENLISPLIRDERVGMSSARPVPVNDTHSFTGFVSRMHWRLHFLLGRHGETIAFRKDLVKHIPMEVSADEAYVEAAVSRQGFKTVQLDNSVVFNKGSETITEFIEQIRRHYAGHLFIKSKFHYVVASMRFEGLIKVAKELVKYSCEHPAKLIYALGYVILE